MIGYARPTGEPVALRLARIKADRHEREPVGSLAWMSVLSSHLDVSGSLMRCQRVAPA